MAATAVTLNNIQGHSSVGGLFKGNPSNISASFYTISTDSVLARFLYISRVSCVCYYVAEFYKRLDGSYKKEHDRTNIFTNFQFRPDTLPCMFITYGDKCEFANVDITSPMYIML